MAVYQTTYPDRPAKGLHGQVANEEKSNRISRTIENAAGVYFGAPVQRGAGDHGVAPFAAGGLFAGLAILNPAVPAVAAGSTLVDGYPQYFTAAIMNEGQMCVVAGGTVKQGDPAYYDTVTRRYVNTTGANVVGPLPAVLFDTSGTDGDIVELSVLGRID